MTIIASNWNRTRVSEANIIAGYGIGEAQANVVKTGQALWGLRKLLLGYMPPSNKFGDCTRVIRNGLYGWDIG